MIEKIGQPTQDRLSQVVNDKNYLDELETLKDKRVLTYYSEIYKNIEIDRKNPNNSYIMWVLGKVDSIDLSKPAKINPGAFSLCDIDIDIPKFKRAEALNYLRNKYGHASVCQMVTYSVLQGRSALKTVLRFNETCSPDEMNEITNNIPELAKVEDQMIAVGEESLIRWTLEYMPERLNQYARLENGVVVGDLAKEFEQAIRLEGAIIGTGKHASAVIVYDGIVKDACPMMPDKSSDELMAGVAMGDADSLGLVKFDLLGLATLDKLMMVKQLLEEKHGH